MARQIDSLSVFLPCYNEEANLEKTYKNVKGNLERNVSRHEIIIVDDGSRDKTGEIADRIAKKDRSVKVIHHRPNRGYGAAFKSGLYSARYRFISFTDADGQFNFQDIYKLIDTQKKTKADLVIGYYLGRKVPFYRKWGSSVWQLAVFLLFGLKVKDIDCGFKLIKKEVVAKIPPLEAERGPFISSEFLIKAKAQGFKIVEVGVRHYARQEGEATGANLNVILSGLTDLLRLWKKLKFS